jgi:hypothetical protein
MTAALAIVLRYWREALIGALVIALMGACVSRDHRIANGAVAKEQSRQADSVLRVVTPQLYHTDTVFVRDSIKVRVALDRERVIRDTLLLNVHDTVLVKQYIQQTDSTIQACSDALNTCALYRTEATATIAALRAKVASAPVINVKSCAVQDGVFALLGAGLGYMAHRR